MLAEALRTHEPWLEWANKRELRALGGVVDEAAFEALSGTVSLPFPAGRYKCVAVKVIDPRGNEVMQVHRL